MKNSRHRLVLSLASLIGVLASSCAPGGHSVVQQPTPQQPTPQQPTVEQPTYLAQSAVANCLPRDPSMVCCIKKFPLTPLESCGATVVEAAEVLNGVKALNEPTQSEDEKASEKKEDDFANNAHLPEWKQRCIKNYYACQQEPDWTGPCYDCLRRCEGQQEWPIAMCGPHKSKPRR